MTTIRFIGVVAGFGGVAVMIGGDALQPFHARPLAELGILIAGISYALAGVFGRRFSASGVPPLATAAGQVTASSAVLAPIALIADQPWTHLAPSMETVGASQVLPSFRLL